MDIKKILKKKDIIKIEPEDTLASALSKLSSSHDSAFIFDKDEFLGIVSPYYTLIKKTFPSHTKVRNVLTHPPRLTFAHKIEHAADMMIGSRIHYLPVFDGKEFVGILSARRILKSILDADFMDTTLGKITKEQKDIVTLDKNEALAKAMKKFKEKKISKIMVTDAKKKLAGILSYYDVIQLFAEPVERQNVDAKKGQKESLLKKSIKNYFTQTVHTLSPDHTLRDAAEMMLNKRVGSVIVVDKALKPLGIVTTKDILAMFTSKPKAGLAQLHVKNVSTQTLHTAKTFAHNLNQMLQKIKDVDKADIMIIEKKKGGMYEAVVSIFRKGKKTRIFRAEDTQLRAMLQDIRDKAKRVLRKK